MQVCVCSICVIIVYNVGGKRISLTFNCQLSQCDFLNLKVSISYLLCWCYTSMERNVLLPSQNL